MTVRSDLKDLVALSAEVREALEKRRPVVALESTIITHGMPYPANLEMARRVETIIRERGAIPATIALVDGAIRVGLDGPLLERIASEKDVAKASRRDIAAILVQRRTAGTTVAATMFCAGKAGIAVFATGGIGGVHRGAAETFDISADLGELATTPVAVVCAGAKSILDIPKTLERLESLGVPVLGIGTDAFPAFFARRSGCPVDHRFETAGEIARVIHTQARLRLPGGILIANPIPEEAALPGEEIEERIDAACREAVESGISRKALTPFLLARINELTEGKSLAANLALVAHNAAVAAEIAVALAALGPAKPTKATA